jgi:hypothetical protein
MSEAEMSVMEQDGGYRVTENGWHIVGPFETNVAAWSWIDRHCDEGRDAAKRSEQVIRSSIPAAERMRQYRRRRRWKRLVVRVELEPAEIEVLVKRGYLDPKDRENFGPIQEGQIRKSARASPRGVDQILRSTP